MARGTPDGGYVNYGTAVNSSDPGQNTDRLLMGGGSIIKTGRVIWATGFEGISSATDFNVSGAGALVTAGGVVTAWQGNNYMALVTQAVLNDSAGMVKYFPASIQTGKWGVEAMIGLMGSLNSTFDFIVKKVGAPSPAPTVQGQIRFVVGASAASVTMQYLNGSGAFVTLDNLGGLMAINTNVYYNMKLVVDFGSNLYSRFILNNKIYDLSAISMYVTGSGADEKSSVQFANTTLDANAKTIAVDNVIITADEV